MPYHWSVWESHSYKSWVKNPIPHSSPFQLYNFWVLDPYSDEFLGWRSSFRRISGVKIPIPTNFWGEDSHSDEFLGWRSSFRRIWPTIHQNGFITMVDARSPKFITMGCFLTGPQVRRILGSFHHTWGGQPKFRNPKHHPWKNYFEQWCRFPMKAT